MEDHGWRGDSMALICLMSNVVIPVDDVMMRFFLILESETDS